MKLTNLVKLFAFSLLLLGVPAIASAQWGGNTRNGGYNDNGNLKFTIKRVKEQSKIFEHVTDNYNNGNLENLADDFRKAADRLDDKYGNGRNMNNSIDAARSLIFIGQQIDRQISYNNGNRGNGRNNRNDRTGNNDYYEWNQIRGDLQQIANAYNIRFDNGGGRNGNGNGRGGRGNGRISIPWPF